LYPPFIKEGNTNGKKVKY